MSWRRIFAARLRRAARALFVVCAALLPGMTAPAERLPLRVFTTSDGLARDHVMRIVPDSRGYVWFATTEGLSRFDGYRFTNYGREQGLPVRIINDFLEAHDGSYWLATSEGIYRFNPDPVSPAQRFVHYQVDEHADANVIGVIYEDRRGTIWCGTLGGLYRLDRTNGEAVFSPVNLIRPAGNGSDSLLVKAIIEDRWGSLWVSAYSGLYRVRPDGNTEVYADREGLPVRLIHGSLLEDHEGRIWVGAGAAIYQLVADPQPGHNIVERVYTPKDGLTLTGADVLFQSADGRLWAGGDGGLSVLSPAAQSGPPLRTYTTSNGLSDHSITAVAEDRDGNIWLGTESGGAMKMTGDGLTSYGEADGLKISRIASLIETADGRLCVISSGGILHPFDGRRFTPIEIPLPAGWGYWGWGWSQTTFQDHLGEWWVATGHGLLRYSKMPPEDLPRARPKAIYTTANGLPTPDVFRLFEDSRGDIWISTLGRDSSVLTRWERATENFQHYSPADGIFQHAPTAFIEDGAGNLWIGFYNGGLLRYAAGRFTPFTAADGLPAGLVRALYLDHAGRLWIATSEGGVARLDDPAAAHPSFAVYSTKDGLASNQATAITEDGWGRIYISTGRGLDRLDPASGHIQHYTTADGLANNFVNVAFRARDGELWFGTLLGLSRFMPQAERPTLPPTMLISGLRIAGVAYPVSELGATDLRGPQLQTSAGQLQIDFVGISLAPGAGLRYQYKLEGADQDWSAPTDERTVNYANLPPGEYRFLVRAVSAGGLMSPSPAAISFRILPPIWRRWWFIALAAAAIAATIYAVDRYRIARLLEMERMRTRIATDLHDDIGSSLSQISVLSEVIRRQVGDHEVVAEPLSLIATLSRDLVDAMNDIVWAINPRRDRLADLSHRMRRFASDVFTARDIAFTFNAPDQQHDTRLDTDVRREVFLVFKETINNVARHAGCTEAAIDFRMDGHWLELSVRDNGKGFDPERIDDGNGLVSMRQRARKIGGALTITSATAAGATVRLKAPVRRRKLRILDFRF
ncbi:MAG TPA: two-component regulator propeller domain-containing protein [Blastocatellia bacterium]|nr:two-component regulator propeller domain-containing protein [Blastocatellia bacterium]